MKNFFRKLDDSRKYAEQRADVDLIKFCDNLKLYLTTTEGLFKYKKATKILSTWTTPEGEASTVLGMSPASIRVARRMISTEAYELFGYDFFDLLKRKDEKEVEKEITERLEMVSLNCSSEKFLFYEIKDRIEKLLPTYDLNFYYTIEDCEDEINFIQKYSKLGFMKELKDLNPQKLNFILGSLDNKCGNIDFRKDLVKRLNGGLSTNE